MTLLSAHTRATESHPAGKPPQKKARHILNEELDKLGWTATELAKRAKGDARKIRIARRLRMETAVTLKWIARELHMGAWTRVANRLQNAKDRNESNNQHELGLV
jgi:hypothetical protein